MDPLAARHHMTTPGALPDPAKVAFAIADGLQWLLAHWYLPLAALLALCLAREALTRHTAQKASRERFVLRTTPASYFDPDAERILRQGLMMLRAANALPWWAPKRSRAVRIKLRSDAEHPLAYQLEGPAGGAKFLRTSSFGDAVTIAPPDADADQPDDERDFQVRGELVLRGSPAASLRAVPLDPDPLQPLVDAVSALQTGLGDLVEICVDLQPAPRLTVRLQRLQLMRQARTTEQREAVAVARSTRRETAAAADSLRTLLTGNGRPTPPLVMPQPRRIDRDQVLGKLAGQAPLARVQILIRCASNRQGRARALLSQVQGGFHVFTQQARLSPRGLRLLGRAWGPDQWPFVNGWQRRWDSGQCRPPRANLARLPELAGLLKPPTTHCTLPLLPTQLPTFRPDALDEMDGLLLQGAVVEADGSRRLVATREEETLFETGLGKAGGGKTERALAQAIMVAHTGGGLLYVDPHRDSFERAAPYLAHTDIIDRIQLIDLTPCSDTDPVGSWNLLDMQPGRPLHDVVAAVVDGLAAGMNWDEANAPRGLTILTACVQVLAAVNEHACHQGQFASQATVFHIRALLTDKDFRTLALHTARQELSEDTLSWWQTVFPTLPYDAFGIILNPLARLAANPVYHAFLGQPHSHFDLRTAMDTRHIIWICTAGNSPTDRLVSSLIAHELLRAGRSRRDTPTSRRVPFRAYLDELITIAGSAPESLAAMFEDLRKYQVRIHGMTQALSRLPQPVRDALLQNSSTLATTTGSRKVITAITTEWGNKPTPDQVAALPRYQHYASFTIAGQRIGPLRLHGLHLTDDFHHLARPTDVPDLLHQAHQRTGSRPLAEQTARAAAQLTQVHAYLTSRKT
ncbi:type IV secretory system conjugative DNA transfer family protein, partial [Streptomyces longispororuber]|uniref:type IV secretory system conjugative DNA transfer family protein n=1 Tax=Streptomyces longispororuber TaxID=68230 RepID=UPI002108FAEA